MGHICIISNFSVTFVTFLNELFHSSSSILELLTFLSSSLLSPSLIIPL